MARPASSEPGVVSASGISATPDWLTVYDARIARPDGEDMVDLEPGLQQVTFRPIALTREPVLDPGTF